MAPDVCWDLQQSWQGKLARGFRRELMHAYGYHLAGPFA